MKLELNGAYRGEIYLEMTYYSAAPPLARRPSKLSPKDRLLRPTPTPPKETTSPSLSPQQSSQIRPSSNTSDSPAMRPDSSLHVNLPSRLYPATSSPPRLDEEGHPTPLPWFPTPPRHVDPTLKNIPFLDVGPSAYTPAPAPAPTPSLYSVPSILRPRNVKSSPIPVPARDNTSPPIPPLPNQDDQNRWFQQELAKSDAAFAVQLAKSEGINVERLRTEEADAELARRLADEERHSANGFASIPGGWVGSV